MVFIGEIFRLQIPHQPAVKFFFLRIGQIDAILPNRSALGAIDIEFTTWQAGRKTIVHHAFEKIVGEVDHAATDVKHSPVEYHIGVCILVIKTKRSVPKIVPDVVPHIHRDQVEVQAIQISGYCRFSLIRRRQLGENSTVECEQQERGQG